MATKTNSERAREYVSNRKSSSVGSSSNVKRNSDSLRKASFERNFKSIQSDLTSLSNTLGNIYNGWQSKDTMKSTLSSVQSMYDRLGKYQEYQKKYGGTDLSELQTAYKSVLDDWDSLSNEYGRYKDASSYTKEKTKLKELSEMKSSDIEGVLGETKELQKILDKAKEYERNIEGLRNEKTSWERRSHGLNLDGSYGKKVEDAENEYADYLKSIGYQSAADIEKALSGKKIAHTTASGQNITWKSLYNSKKVKEESDALYKEISSNADFEEYKKKGASIENPTYEEAEGGVNFFGWRPTADDVKNKVEYSIANKDYILAEGMFSPGGNKSVGDIAYTTMTDQEREIYNYHLGREQAGVAEKGTADKYLDSIYDVLKDRYEGNTLSDLVEFTDDHPVLGSAISVGQNLFSGAEYIRDFFDYLRTGELDDNHLAKASSAIRNTVSQKVDWEIGNWDAFDFVYNTGMSMADSVTSMALLGNAGGVALGLSAAAQGTNDALERGLDNRSAFFTGLTSGVFEGLFESVSIGKFKALKDAPVDGVKSVIKNVGKSMLTNASEETLTELANLTYDYIANGDLSQAKTQIRAYMSAGMSEEEAIRKVALEQAAQVVEAGASGALMGFGFGVVGGGSAYSKNKGVGQTIKSNERTSDMFDLASNPEIGTAYEAYTRYAKKGINADNIKDAQLGSLYTRAKADAMETLKSKKTSAEQKTGAMQTLAKLSVVDTENTVKKEANKLNVGEETKATKSGVAIDIKDLKIKGDDASFVTEKGNVSVDDATLTQKDAEFVVLARGIAQTDGEDAANLFVSQYDGKMDVHEYANSFNLTMAYSKNNFTYRTILNKKGKLSTEAVNAIYQQTRIKADKERQETIKKLNKEMADKMTYKGIINDSVIDYENTSAKGKVNWKDLDTTQKQAVTFIKGFAQASGMNLVLTHNPNSNIGGSYTVSGNTITIDIAKTKDYAGVLRDTIIPTMSHETTHWMKEKSPELWRHLNEIVFTTLTEHYNSNTEQALKDKRNLLNRLGEKYSDESLKERTITEKDLLKAEIIRAGKSEAVSREEIIARACEDMLKMSEQGRKIFKSLSESEQKTLYEKIKGVITDLINWVNDLLNSYESSSTEARIMREYKEQLEKASKVWDEMLKNSIVANQSLEKSGKFKHDGSDGGMLLQTRSVNGNDVVWLEENILKENKGQPVHQFIANFIAEHIGEVYTLIESGQKVYIGEDLPGEYTQSKYTQKVLAKNPNIIKAKNKATANIKEIIEIATNRRWEKTEHSENKDAKFGMYRYDTRFGFPVYDSKGNIVGANIYKAELVIRNASDGRKYLYDIVDIKKDTVSSDWMSKKISSAADFSAGQKNNVYKDSVTNPDEKVKTKISNDELQKVQNVGLQIDSETDSVAPDVLLSERTWNESQYVQDRETAINAIVKAIGVSKKDAARYVDNINSIARMIADDRARLDYEPNIDENASAIKPNSEYKWTVDMSTLCAKRLLFTGTFDAIQKMLPNTVFNSEDIVSLRSMMMERGYEVACGICYVESTRRELGPITAEFIERYKLSQKTGKPITRINSSGKEVELTKTKDQMETTVDKSTDKFLADKNYTPTLAELNTTDIYLVKRDHPLVYEAYLNFMNARGQAKPKLLETRTEYKGEILKHFKSKTAVKSRNDAGGLRVQSFSDFEVAHLIDMMQIVLDMSRVGLMSQAYTKVPAFADVFGNTGMKINLSLIAKDNGLDKNGNLIFDDVEGMPHKEAFRLRDKYSKNVGTILVGKNDAHIRAALADPRIDYVIPFHKSSWKESLYDAMGLTGYDDYTDTQNEKPFDKERKIKNFQPSEYWDYTKSGEENAKTYLKMCADDGRIPKFPQFQNCEGYWKLLIDFKMYDNDGVGSPQMAVKPDFSMDEANAIMNSYEGGHRAYPIAQDVVDDFVKNYEGREDVLYSERDDVGYHAGDLGKSESLGQQGGYRDTGHFGTGTYFVGNKELVKDYNKRDGVPAPQHAVDFSNYNLYKVKSDQDGYDLHRQLHIIDGGINSDWIEAAKDGDFWLYRNTEYYRIAEDKFGEEGKYTDKALIYGLTELAKKANIEIPTKKQYSDKSGYALTEEYFDSVYKDHLQEVVGEKIDDINDEYARFRDAYSQLEFRFGFKGQVYDAMNKVLEYQNANPRGNMDAYKKDSLATVFMKALGYEGVDTRGTKLDNTAYGSVIYDLKEATILYSERDQTSIFDTMGETDRVNQDNEKRKDAVEKLKEMLKLDKKVTKGRVLNEKQVNDAAKYLRKISNSTYSVEKLTSELMDVYSYLHNNPDVVWSELYQRFIGIADSVLAESKPKTEVNHYYKQVLKDIRNTSISLSEAQKKEAVNIFDKNWNRYFFNRVNITDKGIGIESQWQEWSSLYPDIFKADINDGDMIGELYDIINTLQDASETIIEYDAAEQRMWLADEIYDRFAYVFPLVTTADKYNEKIKRLRYEYRNALRDLRNDYNERLANQKIADDIHYGKKMVEQKQSFESKLSEQKKIDVEKQKALYQKLREKRDADVALAKQRGAERLDKYKENAERKTRIQSITANALSLNEMLVKNSKDKHVPEILKGPVTTLLQAIDFSSKRMLEKGEPTRKDISLASALGKAKDMMVKASNAHEELVELYGHGLDEKIESLIDSVDHIRNTIGDNEFILNNMTVTDLQTLDSMVKTIRYAVNQLNKFHTVHHAKGIANLSRESVSYLDSLGKAKLYDGKRGKIKKLLDWGNALPYYVFKRFGSGGMKVYEALQDGWDKFAFNVKSIVDFANETYTDKEVKEWSNEVKIFKILIPASEIDMASKGYTPQYQELQMTIPQIMSMYCLSKREQARGHLFQGGIRVADFKTEKGNIISQSDGVIFTETDVKAIFDSLTERQKAVADKLQWFMNTVCADWGNDVSMSRFGYKAFGEENYFPIQSDKNNLPAKDATEQLNSLFKLLNMSFTKSPIDGANNRIVISDIFDVFAQHTSDMAKYNSLALPVLDSFKWYNFTEKENVAEGTFKTIGVKQSIEKAFGEDGQNYFTTFLKDINGQQEVSRDTLGKGFYSNMKIASVGANLRVVLLQPTSYARASAVIDNKYLLKALGHKPKVKRAETHCGIALWKSMGYYDTNIQRGVEAQIKHNDTWKDKATDWAMKGAEVADKVTWGYLWNACELEVRDKRKDLRVGSEEFYTEIGKRLREVIYATQVVDSTMTRSQMMRSSDRWDKMLTAFASEPTLSYNMLQDAYMELTLDARRMGKKEAWKKNGKRMARIVYAYTMTNAIAALVESAFDAFRDDDDEEMDMLAFLKLYFGNFASDMSITAKIPYIKEIHSAIKGFGSSRSDTQWMEEMTKATKAWYKIFNGKGNATTAIKYSIKTLSDLSGLPFYNVYRDVMASLNKLGLLTAEDLNEMFEDYFD